jgi:cytochrome c
MKPDFRILTAALLAAAVLSANPAAAGGDSKSGEQLFQSHCAACHSLDTNRVGPKLGGVFGRKAGEVPGYNYSSAVKNSNAVWNAPALDKWLSGPQQMIPGQKMNFNVSDPQNRADIIAFLKSQK